MPPDQHSRTGTPRWMSLVWAAATIVAGLVSRQLPWIPGWIGDVLWAATVYFVISALVPRVATWRRATAALIFSYLVEISQLYHQPWIDGIRATTLGHLVLGSTFVWTDLAAYTAGVTLAAVLTLRRRPSSADAPVGAAPHRK